MERERCWSGEDPGAQDNWKGSIANATEQDP